MRKIIIAILFSLLFTFGCQSDHQEALFKTYHQRLANVLNVDAEPVPKTDVPPLPSKRDLAQPLADIRIGLLDAYELRQCGLFQLIAERNSILGKVQDKTRQLHYELLLLNGLHYCLTQLDVKSELFAQLTPIYNEKKQQLPLIYWNMIFTGEEWRKQFSYSHGLLAPSSTGAFFASLNAFAYIDAIINKTLDHAATPSAPTQFSKQYQPLFEHQQKIYNSRYVGELFYSLAHTTTWLNTITQQLYRHQDSILCGDNVNQEQANYLRNVFYAFFAKDIQPYLAKLDSEYQLLHPILVHTYTQLAQPPVQTPPNMQAWEKAYIQGDIYEAFHAANRYHVQFWQTLFKRCNFKVGH